MPDPRVFSSLICYRDTLTVLPFVLTGWMGTDLNLKYFYPDKTNRSHVTMKDWRKGEAGLWFLERTKQKQSKIPLFTHRKLKKKKRNYQIGGKKSGPWKISCISLLATHKPSIWKLFKYCLLSFLCGCFPLHFSWLHINCCYVLLKSAFILLINLHLERQTPNMSKCNDLRWQPKLSCWPKIIKNNWSWNMRSQETDKWGVRCWHWDVL